MRTKRWPARQPSPCLARRRKAARDCEIPVSGKKTLLRRRRQEGNLASKASNRGREHFLLLYCKAKALAKGMCVFHRHRHCGLLYGRWNTNNRELAKCCVAYSEVEANICDILPGAVKKSGTGWDGRAGASVTPACAEVLCSTSL